MSHSLPCKNEQVTWNQYIDELRRKWKEVPGGLARLDTSSLLEMPNQELLNLWLTNREQSTTGEGFSVRGWYHLLYKDVLRSKKVMDVGSGFGIDGITFAQHGADITFVDIVESNLAVLHRLCSILSITNVKFCYLESLESIADLDTDYDVIWCQGSLINAPFHLIREEAQVLLKQLKIGGRWIELAYPKVRWEREGQLPFEQWGEKTDGVGTPWIEWYDMQKLKALLEPGEFETVLHFEFHNSDFNWFDLIRRK